MANSLSKFDLSVPEPDVIAAAQHFSEQVISSGSDGDKILKAVGRFPQSILLQTFAAAFYLFSQTKAGSQQAKIHLQSAESKLSHATAYECACYQAITAWSVLNYELAIMQLTSIVRQWPTDSLAIKLCEWLSYCTGQVTTAPHMLACPHP